MFMIEKMEPANVCHICLIKKKIVSSLTGAIRCSCSVINSRGGDSVVALLGLKSQCDGGRCCGKKKKKSSEIEISLL